MPKEKNMINPNSLGHVHRDIISHKHISSHETMVTLSCGHIKNISRQSFNKYGNHATLCLDCERSMVKPRLRMMDDKIKEALDGNWTNSNMGSLEEMEEAIKLLSDGLAVTIALLIKHDLIDKKEFMDNLQNGCMLKELK